MIRVARGKQPSILRTNAKRWAQALALASTKKHKARAQGRYRHPKIRAALRAAFRDKCGYCEAVITHIDYGHIEHYRPKAAYPAGTFRWSNLLLGCGICNGPLGKGDTFPNKLAGGPIINPCAEDPKLHFAFRWDAQTKLARVVPLTARGSTTERLLRLNRDELIGHRSVHVSRVAALLLLGQHDAQGKALLAEVRAQAIAGKEEYAAFVRELLGV